MRDALTFAEGLIMGLEHALEILKEDHDNPKLTVYNHLMLAKMAKAECSQEVADANAEVLFKLSKVLSL